MNTRSLLGLSLPLSLALSLTACGSSDCPAGTTPVDGRCVAPSDDGGVDEAPDACVPESCNGEDDDCDGTADDDFACVAGATTACTTSCGSTGTQACDATCALAACEAPAEVCNGVDDDCDGAVDEGLITLGDRIDLGGARRGFEVLPRDGGYVAVWTTSSELYGQLLDTTGAPIADAVSLRGLSTEDFAAAVRDSTLYVLAGGSDLRGYRFSTTDLSVLGTATGTDLGVGAPRAITRVAMAVTSERVVAVYAFAVGSAFQPSIATASTTFTDVATTGLFWNPTEPEVEAELAPDGSVLVAVGGPFEDASATLLRVSETGVIGAAYNHPASSDAAHDVQVAEGTTPSGDRVLGMLFRRDASVDSTRFTLFDIAADGGLTARDSIDLARTAPVHPTFPSGLDLAFSNGHFFATWLEGTSGASTWRLAEITAPDSGSPEASSSSVEDATASNGAVRLAVRGRDLLVGAMRTDAIARAYLRGCH